MKQDLSMIAFNAEMLTWIRMLFQKDMINCGSCDAWTSAGSLLCDKVLYDQFLQCTLGVN